MRVVPITSAKSVYWTMISRSSVTVRSSKWVFLKMDSSVVRAVSYTHLTLPTMAVV